MSAAAAFSSRYLRRLVPGMGTMSSPWARTQASASCAGVMSFSSAISRSFATILMFASRFSPWNRGWVRLKSSSASSSGEAKRPERKPRPSGE